jgi:adenosine deaminase
MQDLEAVLRKFLATQKILSSEEILARITHEQIEDAYREGIRILELRYAPTFVRQGHEHLTFDRIHRAILDGISRASHLPIAVGLIAIIQRVLPLEDGARVADFAIANKDTFVALDLADNEVGFDPKPFAPHFARAKTAGLRITVHSGEAIFPGSAECVRTAIEILGAERIGHGVQIAGSPSVLEFVRERGVPLELCPTSNWLTNAVPTLEAHPFKKLMNAGVKVTINSDDPGVFGIDLTNEYRVLHEKLGLSEADFTRINDTAAAHSFVPLAARRKVWPRPINDLLG